MVKNIEAIVLFTDDKSLSVEERAFVERYWKFSCCSGGFPVFDESVAQLKSNRPSRMSSSGFDRLIREGSSVTLNHSAFSCQHCQKKYTVNARRDLIRKLRLMEEVWTCEECCRNDADQRLYGIIEFLEYKEAARQDSGECHNFNCSMQDLNFTEKVSLFGILTEMNIPGSGATHADWNDINLLGSRTLDDSMLAALIKKGAILEAARVDTGSYIDLLTVAPDAERYLDNASPEIAGHYRHIVREKERLRSLTGLRFGLANQSEYYRELAKAIFENLTTQKLSLEEFELVKEYIEQCLLEKAMFFVTELHNECGLQLNQSIRLESVLLRTMNDFTPGEAFRLMKSQIVHLTSTIHQIEHSTGGYRGAKYEKNIYARLLDGHMERAKQLGWDIYPLRTPFTLGSSFFEEFLAIHILGEKSSWDHLTGTKVISLALAALVE